MNHPARPAPEPATTPTVTSTTGTRPCWWWRRDDGMTGVAASVMLLAAIAGGGLIFDGGRALAARRDAINNAEAAARAGAQELGFAGLDTTAATDAARDHLLAAGVDPADIRVVSVTGNTVTVTITARRDAVFTDLLGNDTIVVAGTGEATASFGATP